MRMSKVLVVGNLTLDLILSVDHYPAEDEELRASAQRYQRGGNAANSADVLAQHGHRVSFAGTLAADANGHRLAAELAQLGIDTRHCQVFEERTTPLSCILHNQQTGSRTIVHYRDLPEYAATAFAAIALAEYDGFHFEGRNPPQLIQMLAQLHRVRVDQVITVEIEKPRPGIEQVFAYADVLLFSRAFARASGYTSARQLFDQVQAQAAQAILVCTWGEQGAYARRPDGIEFHQAAEEVGHICDSVGAGDTFNAGLLHALLNGQSLQLALAYANALAARKLRQHGFGQLMSRGL